MLLVVKKNIGVMLVSLLLSGWVTAGEAGNVSFTRVNIQDWQDESLDTLQNENQLNQDRVRELEQKMAELLRQLQVKEKMTQVQLAD